MLQRDASSQHGGEADLAVDVEPVMNGRAAEVGIDEQNANIALGKDAGEVHSDRGLAFAGSGAGQQDYLGLPPGNGQQQRGAQGAEGFRELRHRRTNDPEISLYRRLRGDLRSAAANAWDERKRRKAGDGFDLRDGADAGVKALKDEGDDDAERQHQDPVDQHHAGAGLQCGSDRRNGVVDDVDLGRLETSLDAGGAKALRETFVECAVGFKVALAKGVLDEVVAELIGLGLLRLERAAGLLLVITGGNVGFMCLVEQAFLFVADLLVDFVDLGGEGLGLRMIRAEIRAELRVLRQELFASASEAGES